MPTYKQRVVTAMTALANPNGSTRNEIYTYLLQNDEQFRFAINRGRDKTVYVNQALRALVIDGVLTRTVSPWKARAITARYIYKFTQEYLNTTQPSNTSSVTVEKTVTVDEQLAEQLAEAEKNGAVVDLYSDEEEQEQPEANVTSDINSHDFLIYTEVESILKSGSNVNIPVAKLYTYQNVKSKLEKFGKTRTTSSDGSGSSGSGSSSSSSSSSISSSSSSRKKKSRSSSSTKRKKTSKKRKAPSSGSGVSSLSKRSSSTSRTSRNNNNNNHQQAQSSQNDDDAITIRVKDHRGEETFFKMKMTTEMSNVFRAYAQRRGVPRSKLYFLLDGERINHNDTPRSLELEDQDQINCLLAQTGSIGHFKQHSITSRGAHFLNSCPLPQIDTYPKENIGKFNANATFTSGFNILNTTLCNKLKEYADTKYQESLDKIVRPDDINNGKNGDLKIDIDMHFLETLIGKNTVKKMCQLFPGSIDEIKIRRCAAHKQWIKFHYDHFTNITMQVPLNDESEYVGGKLVFVNGNCKISVPSRPAGSYTIHDDTILHGVSRLDSGVRYGLFFLGSY